jgi:hypothetical protein
MAHGTLETPPPAGNDYQRFIDDQLRRTRRRVWSVDVTGALLMLLVWCLACLAVMVVADHWLVYGGLGFRGRLTALVVLLAGIGALLATVLLPLLLRRVNPLYAAATIERSRPGLKNSLINLLQLRSKHDDLPPVVYHAVEVRAAQDLSASPAESAVDRSRIVKLGYVLLAVVVCATAYKLFSPKDPVRSVERVLAPWADISPPTRVQIEEVQPGAAEAFYDDRLKVSARVEGLQADEPVTLFYTTVDGQVIEHPVRMIEPDAGSRFTVELPDGSTGLQQDLDYYLKAGDATSAKFHVRVVTVPSIAVDRVEYKYPEYTRLPPRTAERQGDLRALEGTQVTIHARATHDIKSAHVDFSRDGRRDLAMRANGRTAVVAFTLKLKPNSDEPEHGNYQLLFTNREGADNPRPMEHKIEIVRDLPPEIVFLEPKPTTDSDDGQLKAARLTEQGSVRMAVEASDPDFRLAEMAIVAERNGKPLMREELLAAERGGRVKGSYIFDAKKYQLRAGDRIVYWGVATDNKQPEANRTETPKYTLEIVATVKKKDSDELADARPPEKKPPLDQRPRDEQQQAGKQPPENRNDPPEQGKQQPQDELNKDQKIQNGEPEKKNDRIDPDTDPGDAIERINQHFDNKPPQPQNDKPHPQPGDQQPPSQQPPPKPDGRKNEEPKDGDPQQGADQKQGGKSDKQQGQQQKGGQQGGGDRNDEQQQPNAGQQNGQQQGEQQQGQKQNGQLQQPGRQGQQGDQKNQQQPGDGQQQGNGQKSGDQRQADPNAGGGKQQQGEQQPGQQQNGEGKQQPGQQQASGEQKQGAQQNPGQQQQADGKQQGDQKEGGQQQRGQQNQGQQQAGDQKQQGGKQQPGEQKQGAQQNQGGQQGDQQKQGGAQQPGTEKQPNADKQAGGQQQQGGQKQPGDQKNADQKNGGQQQPGDQKQASGQQQPGEKGDGEKPGQPKSGEPQNGAKPGDKNDPAAQKDGGQQKADGQPKADGEKKADGQKQSDAKNDEHQHDQQNDAKDSKVCEKCNGKGCEACKNGGGAKSGGGSSGSSGGQGQQSGSESKPGDGGKTNDAVGKQQSKPDSENKQSGTEGENANTSQSNGGKGESSDNKKGNPASQEGNRPRNQQSGGDDKQPKSEQGDEASSPSRDKSDSNSEGETGGDLKGGAKDGGGQKADKAGTGSQGKNTASDEGGSKAQEKGKGETGERGGDGPKADKPTEGAKQGKEPGNGSQSRPAQKNGGEQKSGEPKQPNDSQQPGQQQGGNNQPGPSDSRKHTNAVTGSGNPTSGGPADHAPPPQEAQPTTAPDGDPANLDYARKATDLALERLKDQLDKGQPDQELLDKLKWSKDDLRRFVERWENMKKAAAEPGAKGQQAREELDKTLKNLGLRPHGTKLGPGADDRSRSMRETRRTAPPAEYADQYRAYNTGTSQAKDK